MKAVSSKDPALIWHENEELLLLDDRLTPTLLISLPPPPIPPFAQIIPEGERFFFTNSSKEKLERNELDEEFISALHPLETSRRDEKTMSNTIRFMETHFVGADSNIRIGFFPKSRRGSRWMKGELWQACGIDPASTLEGIQLDKTAVRSMEIEWSSRLTLRRVAAEGEVAGEW